MFNPAKDFRDALQGQPDAGGGAEETWLKHWWRRQVVEEP